MRQTYRRISFCAFHVMRTILRPNADIDYWRSHAAQYAALLTPYHVRLTALRLLTPHLVRVTALEASCIGNGPRMVRALISDDDVEPEVLGCLRWERDVRRINAAHFFPTFLRCNLNLYLRHSDVLVAVVQIAGVARPIAQASSPRYGRHLPRL